MVFSHGFTGDKITSWWDDSIKSTAFPVRDHPIAIARCFTFAVLAIIANVSVFVIEVLVIETFVWQLG